MSGCDVMAPERDVGGRVKRNFRENNTLTNRKQLITNTRAIKKEENVPHVCFPSENKVSLLVPSDVSDWTSHSKMFTHTLSKWTFTGCDESSRVVPSIATGRGSHFTKKQNVRPTASNVSMVTLECFIEILPGGGEEEEEEGVSHHARLHPDKRTTVFWGVRYLYMDRSVGRFWDNRAPRHRKGPATPPRKRRKTTTTNQSALRLSELQQTVWAKFWDLGANKKCIFSAVVLFLFVVVFRLFVIISISVKSFPSFLWSFPSLKLFCVSFGSYSASLWSFSTFLRLFCVSFSDNVQVCWALRVLWGV